MNARPHTRELHLNVNLLGTGTHHGSWRWPGADPLTFINVERYVESARIAERGLLDAVFLGDIPGLVENITTHPQFNALEPTLILTAIARATEHIGLIATASTSYNEPYNLARRLQALDLISHGRTAWNAVTTYAPNVARNFVPTPPDRRERYARASEFVDVVRQLWTSWEPGAVPADVQSGHYAEMSRIRPIDHKGTYFTVEGPLCLPPSEQGHPVILQAGGSDEGRTLAAATADAVFSGALDIEAARTDRADIRRRVAATGRDGSSIVILPGLTTSVGGTEREALERRERLDELEDRSDQLRRLATQLTVDPRELELDKPVPETLLTGAYNPVHGHHRKVSQLAHEGLTVRDILRRGGGSGHLVAAGSPEQIADIIEQWFTGGAADGFNVMPDVMDDGLPAFVDHVVPVLQRRGLFRTEYRGSTMRDHYGLEIPASRAAAIR
ncbi:NtaA/DmoA family FMN-dependent monooxygenase [Streptomyces sp. NPDC087901]|uniref:NtaA/DmoA family FMN-dependent monooxygenase n=1 Tax=Streptomyces sp. NPDC087901 TaxID=3365818 RepID=UPI00382E16F6